MLWEGCAQPSGRMLRILITGCWFVACLSRKRVGPKVPKEECRLLHQGQSQLSTPRSIPRPTKENLLARGGVGRYAEPRIRACVTSN